MRLGINLRIDVSKLDKSRFFKGKKGTYCELTAFIDTENTSEYGDNGTITQQTSKEERDGGLKLPICGNAKIFYTAESEQQSPGQQPIRQSPEQQMAGPDVGDGYDPDSDILY